MNQLAPVEMLEIERLRTAISQLTPRDQTFAASLVAQAGTAKGLSNNQWRWVGILNQRASDKPPAKNAPATVAFIGLEKIIAMMDKTRAAAKRPPIVTFIGKGTDYILRLSYASAQAQFPNSLHVVIKSDDAQQWIGRVHRDGRFEPGSKCPTPELIFAALQNFAKNPAAAATAYGRRTGRCTFCARELTDATSIRMGYGEICADNYGLPYG